MNRRNWEPGDVMTFQTNGLTTTIIRVLAFCQSDFWIFANLMDLKVVGPFERNFKQFLFSLEKLILSMILIIFDLGFM